MEIVKVRRVGNSNVITLPREMERYGFVEGSQVTIEAAADGELRLVSVEKMREHRERVRQASHEVMREYRRSLEILAESEGVTLAPLEEPSDKPPGVAGE